MIKWQVDLYKNMKSILIHVDLFILAKIYYFDTTIQTYM